MDRNDLRFRPDGSFRILQISDAQDIRTPKKAMLRMLEAAYDKLRPDLILFTGDNVLGNHLNDIGYVRVKKPVGYETELKHMRGALERLLEPVERRGIPFAMIFGNHDDMNGISKDAQCDIWRGYPHCLPMNCSDASLDRDTYAIRLLDTSGAAAWLIYMLDSAWNDEEGQHWRIKEETVRFYEKTSDGSLSDCGRRTPSLMFIHEPLPQIGGLLRKCEKGCPGSVDTSEGSFVLDPLKAHGVLGESVSPCEDPFGLFDAVKSRGDVKAVVSCHDHLNCFDGVADGVRMIASGAASFRCYGSRVRGVRLFDLREDCPGDFETRYFTYDMLCGHSLPARFRYFMDADDLIPAKFAFFGVAAALAVCAAAAGAIITRKR